MVKGVHLHIAKALVLAVAVPTFPDGGGTLLNGVAPRGVGGVLNHAVGNITAPHVGESG